MTEFGHVLGVLEPWVHHYGSAAVFVIILLESFGMPLPGESLLIIKAKLAGRGENSFAALFVGGCAGAIVGDNIGYFIGGMLGRTLLLRYGGKIGLTAERLAKIEAVFARHGAATVAIAPFVNVLRQLNGVVAGTMKLPWWKFATFNALGSALWVAVWTTIGAWLGKHGKDLAEPMRDLGSLGAAIAIAAVISIAVYIYRKRARAIPQP